MGRVHAHAGRPREGHLYDLSQGLIFWKMIHLRSLLLLALFLRFLLPLAALLVTADPAVFCSPDSYRYLGLAASLAREGRYAGPDGPELFRPPAYPLLVSVGTFVDHPYLVTIFLQALLGCLTVYLIYRSAYLFFGGQRAASFAGLACACDPLLVVYGSMLLSETLFATLLTLAVLLLLRYAASQSVKWLVLSAFAVSASAYVRVIAYFLPFCIAIILAIQGPGRPGWRRVLTHATLFLGICMALLGAWQLRNGITTGYFGFSTQIDLALYAKGKVVAARKERAVRGVSQEVIDELQATSEQPSWSVSQKYAMMRRRGLALILEAPGTFAWIHLKGTFLTLFAPGAAEYRILLRLSPQSIGVLRAVWDRGVIEAGRQLISIPPLMLWITAGMSLALLPYLLLSARTLLRFGSADRAALVIVWSIILYVIVFSGGPSGSARLRVPIMPLLSILVGYELSRLTGCIGKRASPA